MIPSNKKLKDLKIKIKKMEKVIIAFSGGVDSTFLLKFCVDVLGREKVLAVTGKSEIHHNEEIEEAKKIAEMLKVDHYIVHIDMLNDKEVSMNRPDRCYFCKSKFYSKFRELANKKNINYILDGSNRDDTMDFRPGRTAAMEKNVVSPLLEVELTKEEVRKVSKEMNIYTWSKPSQACLASRIPYGRKITRKKINMVAEAERFLKNLGFKTVRVRHHGKLAKIEVDEKNIDNFLEDTIRKKVIDELRKIGYTWICLDLKGYKSGSMNEGLNKDEKKI